MTTLLLTRGPDPRVVQVRRCGVFTRLMAHVRWLALDLALVNGTSPDSSPAVALRARYLIGFGHRLALARELRAVLLAAGRSVHRCDPTPPVPAHVLRNQDLIEEALELLEGGEAIEARGVARLELLLRDGAGPLYAVRGGPALRAALQNAIDALVISPEITADA
jgi:hypothetical protein